MNLRLTVREGCLAGVPETLGSHAAIYIGTYKISSILCVVFKKFQPYKYRVVMRTPRYDFRLILGIFKLLAVLYDNRPV